MPSINGVARLRRVMKNRIVSVWRPIEVCRVKYSVMLLIAVPSASLTARGRASCLVLIWYFSLIAKLSAKPIAVLLELTRATVFTYGFSVRAVERWTSSSIELPSSAMEHSCSGVSSNSNALISSSSSLYGLDPQSRFKPVVCLLTHRRGVCRSDLRRGMSWTSRPLRGRIPRVRLLSVVAC